jgi:hypothetical protein
MNTIFASATLSDLVLVPSLMICAAIFAQLLGVPVAWVRLRRTEVWATRPPDVRRLDLLVAFSGRPVALAAALGGLVGFGVWIGMVFS